MQHFDNSAALWPFSNRLGTLRNVLWAGFKAFCVRLWQVEIDYKSECMAGQTVESLGSRIQEDTNGTGVLRSDPFRVLNTLRIAFSGQ